jgi:hypothetical protein
MVKLRRTKMTFIQKIIGTLLLVPLSLVAADQAFKPFVLAQVTDVSLENQTESTVRTLEAAGFELVGQHSVRAGANVLVVTSPELLAIAAASDKGGYGAAQRISVVATESGTEVTFVNPVYIQHAYRLEADMQPVLDQLVAALGQDKQFGAKKKMTANKLAKYHYMMGMQRFDDPSELGAFDSYETALAAVENGLSAADELTLIYRIDIPGKDQSLFGVGMKASGGEKDDLDIDEAHQLEVVDYEGPAKVAYFPYEILVNDDQVEALHMRFRMAVHFPDLSMMGKHGFTKLMSSPGATEDMLQAAVSSQ